MLGYNIKIVQERHAQCSLSIHIFPKASRNKETRNLHKNVRNNYILKSITATGKHQTKQIFSKILLTQTNESV